MDYLRNPYGINPYNLGSQGLGTQSNRVPFYMAYPESNNYQDEMEYDRDMEKMKQMYPKQAREIQKYIEEECDKMEYEGSQMFDDYPDQVSLQSIAKRICDIVEMQSIEAQQRASILPYPPGPGPRPGPGRHYVTPCPHRPPVRGGLARDLVEVMLFNEIYKRRCRHRRCRRWW